MEWEGFMKKPNIFDYATSELSQDAFLKWLIEHVNLNDNEDLAKKVANNLIQLIIERYTGIFPERKDTLCINDNFNAEIDKKSQSENIDVFVTLHSKADNVKYAILIEDKAWSNESRKEQVETYMKKKTDKDPTLLILPVYLQTGYMSQSKFNEFYMRKIVPINYKDIYTIISKEAEHISHDIVLISWWESFLTRFYRPIEATLEQINSFFDQGLTIASMLSKISKEKHMEKAILFDCITNYLFKDSTLFQIFNVDGKPGRTQFEYILYKEGWRHKERKYLLGFYFTYNDKGKPTLDIKTIPKPYTKRTAMNDEELNEYKVLRENLRGSLMKNADITNNYWTIKENDESKDKKKHILQIMVSNDLGHLPMKILKKELNDRINTITEEL